MKLKREPFQLICSGKKTLEYRDATEYWSRRLMQPNSGGEPREFDFVFFRNGYRAYSPGIVVRWLGTTLDPVTHKYVIAIAKID